MHQSVSNDGLPHDRDAKAQAVPAGVLVRPGQLFKLLFAGLTVVALLGAPACAAASGGASGGCRGRLG